jgi:FMN phosphatase YigB (HAD superfamily)
LTYKAIIFDLGSVIFSAGFLGYGIFSKAGDIWNLAKVNEISCDEMYSLISKRIDMNKEKLKDLFLTKNELLPKIKELIIKLSEKYKIGFLTNIIEDVYNKDLQLWNFEEVGPVVASFIDKVKKPDTNAIDLIIKKLKIDKSDVIFIDDNRNTVEKYNKYGVKSIKYNNYENLIQNLKELGIK